MQGGGGGGSDFTALNLGFNGSKNQIKELHHHFVHVGVFAELVDLSLVSRSIFHLATKLTIDLNVFQTAPLPDLGYFGILLHL